MWSMIVRSLKCKIIVLSEWYALKYVGKILVVNARVVAELALHLLPTGPLQTHSVLKPVSRCEPSTYQPISHYAIKIGIDRVLS